MSEVEELDENALFNDAVSDQPASPPEPVTAEPEQPETPATETATSETPEEKPEVDDNAAQVPSWRVREINEEKRALAEKLTAFEAEKSNWQREQQDLRQRLNALEKPSPKVEEDPDPLLDPKGYRDFMEKRFEERLTNERREIDLRLTRQSDPATFDKAYQEAARVIQSGDRSLVQQMNNSASPGQTLLNWYKQNSTLKEVGTDPTAWLEKKLEERLSDPAFLAKAVERARGVASPQQQNGRPRVDLPPSLNGASRSSAVLKSSNDDVSDHDLFQQITG